MREIVADFEERVRQAAAAKKPLRLKGGGSKDFYGGSLVGDVLETRSYAGIVSYDPTELVVTCRCGTPLVELEQLLAGQGQMLAFEPPHFGESATVGGAVASGLSGPRRATSGSLRDFVLGAKLIDGRGEVLNFGGQVMKNVAGYDVSRLIAGSMGTLGLILEVSLKVLPRAAAELTLRQEAPQVKALQLMNSWAGRPLPISATCWEDGLLSLRLAGARAAVAAARQQLGGELVEDGKSFWQALREQRTSFFKTDSADSTHLTPSPLWRFSLPSVTPPLPGAQLIEWGGSLRWARSGEVRLATEILQAGGHVTLFRGSEEARSLGVFQALPPTLMSLHKKLKSAFDPAGIFNPGRLFPEL